LHSVCFNLYCGGFILFCNVWVCACVGFVMCGCSDNFVGVLVICVLVFTVLYCFYCFVYVYLFLFVLSVLVLGLLPPSDNSLAVNNNNNNNNVCSHYELSVPSERAYRVKKSSTV
jgi:hypothetical protein